MAKARATKAAAKAAPATLEQFSHAAPAEKAKGPAKKEGTLLKFPERGSDELHNALASYRAAAVQVKSAEEQKEAAKETLLPAVSDLFCQVWAEKGDRPDGPITIENRTGSRLTYVVSDRSAGAEITDEQHAELLRLLGAKYEEMTEVQTAYMLNPEVLGQPGVMLKVVEALKAAKLTKDQRDNLLLAKKQRVLKEKIVPHLAKLAGSAQRLLAAFNLLPKAITRYLQA